MKKLATLVAALALAVPGVAIAGPGDSVIGGDGGGSYPLMGAKCDGWAIGYCLESGKVVPCRCAKVLQCGVWVWAWVPANTPPA